MFVNERRNPVTNEIINSVTLGSPTIRSDASDGKPALKLIPWDPHYERSSVNGMVKIRRRSPSTHSEESTQAPPTAQRKVSEQTRPAQEERTGINQPAYIDGDSLTQRNLKALLDRVRIEKQNLGEEERRREIDRIHRLRRKERDESLSFTPGWAYRSKKWEYGGR